MIEKLRKKYGLFMPGEIIPGLQINGKPAPYPVVNERSVRAGAGMLFLLAGSAFGLAFLTADFRLLKIVVVILFIDFFMKVFLGPKFSIVSRIAGFIVRKQKPEYVGGIQKRFAWSIGLLMATLMIFLLFVFQVQGIINLTMCILCLSFMWLESSCGICVGCKIYYAFLRWGILKEPEVLPACPGGACPIIKPV